MHSRAAACRSHGREARAPPCGKASPDSHEQLPPIALLSAIQASWDRTTVWQRPPEAHHFLRRRAAPPSRPHQTSSSAMRPRGSWPGGPARAARRPSARAARGERQRRRPATARRRSAYPCSTRRRLGFWPPACPPPAFGQRCRVGGHSRASAHPSASPCTPRQPLAGGGLYRVTGDSGCRRDPLATRPAGPRTPSPPSRRAA